MVEVLPTLTSCKDALRKFVARLPQELVPPPLTLLAAKVGEVWGNATVPEAARQAALQCWMTLLPPSHLAVLGALLAHWHRLATESCLAENALSKLAPSVMEMLWRKPPRQQRAALTRFCEVMIACPHLASCAPQALAAAEHELARLQPQRLSWEGAWPLLPPHSKSEARTLNLELHRFLLATMDVRVVGH